MREEKFAGPPIEHEEAKQIELTILLSKRMDPCVFPWKFCQCIRYIVLSGAAPRDVSSGDALKLHKTERERPLG